MNPPIIHTITWLISIVLYKPMSLYLPVLILSFYFISNFSPYLSNNFIFCSLISRFTSYSVLLYYSLISYVMICKRHLILPFLLDHLPKLFTPPLNAHSISFLSTIFLLHIYFFHNLSIFLTFKYSSPTLPLCGLFKFLH